MEKGLIAYGGDNTTLYVGCLDFALERKLRRLGAMESRTVDLSDAVTLIRRLKGHGHPLSWEYIQGLDGGGVGMGVSNAGIHAAADEHVEKYDSQGIVEMKRDETSDGWGYVDLRGEWAWVT